MGHYKCNKNGIRDKQGHVKTRLKMITRIKQTRKYVMSKDECGMYYRKYLFTARDTVTGKTLFRYAESFPQAKERFLHAVSGQATVTVETIYPSLDILLNNEFIITN